MDSPKKSSASLSYPQKGSLNRLIYKLPLLLWRMGLGPILSHPSRGGKKMMVVTTRGRKSGHPRHTMVSCIDFDQKYYAVSGWWLHSDWVMNFHQDPLVTVQAANKIYSAHARRVEDLEEIRGVAQALFDSGGDSHFKDWLNALEINDNLEALLEKRDQVNFVGFDRTNIPGPDPLPADLIWIWAILLSVLLGILYYIWG